MYYVVAPCQPTKSGQARTGPATVVQSALRPFAHTSLFSGAFHDSARAQRWAALVNSIYDLCDAAWADHKDWTADAESRTAYEIQGWAENLLTGWCNRLQFAPGVEESSAHAQTARRMYNELLAADDDFYPDVFPGNGCSLATVRRTGPVRSPVSAEITEHPEYQAFRAAAGIAEDFFLNDLATPYGDGKDYVAVCARGGRLMKIAPGAVIERLNRNASVRAELLAKGWRES